MIVEICQSGPHWWTDQLTDKPTFNFSTSFLTQWGAGTMDKQFLKIVIFRYVSTHWDNQGLA